MSKNQKSEILDKAGNKIAVVPSGFSIDKPEQALELAKMLKDYSVQNQLTADIKGKTYAMVEAWQFAGSQLGIIPIIQSCERVVENVAQGEVKYRAEVTLERLSDGKVLGRGFAWCSNKESKKKSFEEFAIASMAQTRAIGKAFRSVIAWFMKAAGYEGTPMEEMEGADGADVLDTDIIDAVQQMETVDALLEYAGGLTHLHKNLDFRKLVDTKRKELEKGVKNGK